MNIQIANRLATLRRQHNLSQEQLAEQLGISRQAVSKWERAESSPDTDNLIALAQLYKVSLDRLLEMDEESACDEQFAREDRARQAAEAAPETPDAVAPDPQTAEGNASIEESPLTQSAAGPDALRVAEIRQVLKRVDWEDFPFLVPVAILYVILGFYFNLWHPGWLIFFTIPIYYTAIEDNRFNLGKVPYPLFVAPVYLIMGFYWNLWHPGWLIFLTIPLYYWIEEALPSLRINVPMIAAIAVAIAVIAYRIQKDGIVGLVMIGAVLCIAVLYNRPRKK